MENGSPDFNEWAKKAFFLSDLEEKYSIKGHQFDIECIYKKEDLTALLVELLKLGGFDHQVVAEGLDEAENQYFTHVSISDRLYEFQTNSLGDHVDLEGIMIELDRLTKTEAPDYQYNRSNLDGGQLVFLIYAETEALKLAIAEGYPCSLPGDGFKRAIDWEWGIYSIVTLPKLPPLDDLHQQYHKAIAVLYSSGYDVPKLTLERIELQETYAGDAWWIYIDGAPVGPLSNAVSGNQVTCSSEATGLILGYTLVKHYQGQVALYNEKEAATSDLDAEKYLNLVSNAFGKRNQS